MKNFHGYMWMKLLQIHHGSIVGAVNWALLDNLLTLDDSKW